MEVRRVYRSRSNRMLAGVCSGIAQYFNIDPTVVRVVWALAALMGGTGVLAYIICWIIIPDER